MHRVTLQRDAKQDVRAQQSGPREYFKERQPLDGVSFAQLADSLHNSIGYRGILIHDLRRSAVRTLNNLGVPQSVAMALVGHETDSIYRRYSITSEVDREAAVRKIEEGQQEAALAELRAREEAHKTISGTYAAVAGPTSKPERLQ